jgi:hypothetical protein
MKPPKVTLTVQGTTYVPIRATELQRLRAVDKAAREVVKHGSVHRPSLRKLAQAVRQ